MENQTAIDSYPLSPMQQGMLFNTLYERHSGVDIEQMVVTLHEKLELTQFKRSWQRVIERHPILRTSFNWKENDRLLQEVYSEIPLPLQEQDLSNLSASEQENKLQAYLEADRKQGFQLDEPPLFRLAIFKLSEVNSKFIWTFHHALLDGRSFPIVLKEVFAFYDSFCQGEDLQLETPRPYRDYIDWLQQQDFSQAEKFWRQFLHGFTAPTPLTVDKALLSDRKHLERIEAENNFGEQEIRISAAIAQSLQSLAREHQITLNTLLQGTWALLLSRYSGERDILFGATKSCRRSTIPEAESMVGLLINTLPIRVTVSPKMPLITWLKELRQQWIKLRDYEHTPLVNIQGWSEVPGGTSLFDSIFIFENYLLNSSLRSQGGRWKNLEFKLIEQTNYPLALIGYLDTELLLKIKYDRRRFDDATIARMLGHIKTLLESQAANPWQCLGELPLLTAGEQHQMLVQWNHTQTNYCQDTCIHHLFEAKVKENPDAIAVIFKDEQLTYRELNDRANKLARYLQSQGVQPEVIVGICVQRSLQMVIGLLGILKAGGAYVPLDPSYPPERLQFMLQDTKVSVLLTQQHLANIIPEYQGEIIGLDADWEKIDRYSSENLAVNVVPENLAYSIYTSGSTGKPKGVLVEHQAICHELLWRKETFKLTSEDRILQTIPLAFDPSVWQIFGPLIAGSTLVVAPPEAHKDSAEIVRLVVKYKVTILDFVPAMLKVFLAESESGKCTSLRHVFCGGEALPANLVEQFKSRLSATISNQYGPTEACIDTTFWHSNTGVLNGQIVPIGRPIANKQVYILDPHLQPVPIGVPGELYVGGSLSRGYLNRPELTADRFISIAPIDLPLRNTERSCKAVELPDRTNYSPSQISHSKANRLYKTGDLVRYLNNGEIEYLGRIDNQVKIRGVRIEIGEVEAQISQLLEVKENLVIARPDPQGHQCLVAYIVPEINTENLTAASLRQALAQHLPAAMIPSVFTLLEELPKLPNGKINRRALPEPDWFQSKAETFVAPSNEWEIKLANIWQQVLGTERIGIKDNFFELGGHSLLALSLFAQIERSLGKNLPIASIFEAATIEEQAKLLQNEENLPSPSLSCLVALQPQGSKPPFFWVPPGGCTALRYTYLARYMGSDRPCYSFQPRGIDGKQAPLDRIESIASEYLQEVKTVQPRGPYFLGGQCAFGCFVAFEMAQQLKARGEEVAMLVMLDPRHEIFLKNNRQKSHSDGFSQGLNAMESLNPEKSLSFYLRRFTYLWQNRKLLDRIWQKLVRIVTYISSSPTSRQVDKVFRAHLTSIWYYQPKIYPGRIAIFQSPHRAKMAEYGEWSWIASEGLDFYTTSCSHRNILEEPHVQNLAKQLINLLKNF